MITWLRSPYVASRGWNVKISSLDKVSNPAVAPFQAEVDQDGTLTLTFSSELHLSVLAGTRLLHSPESLRALDPTRLRLRAVGHRAIEIRDGIGRRWRVGVESIAAERVAGEARELLASLRNSSLAHVAFAALAAGVFQTGSLSLSSLDEQSRAQRMQMASLLVSGSAQTQVTPFGGRSVREVESYRRAQAQDQSLKNATNQGRMAALSGLLSGVGGGKIAVQGDTAQGDSGLGRAAVAAVSRRELLPARRAPRETVAAPAVASTVSASASREARLRQKLDVSLKPLLTRAYDEALRLDPSLSVVLGYEASVGTNGRSAQVKIKARGTGSPAALSLLERGAKSAFERLEVETEFAGVVLKGEQVFVR